MGMKDAKAVFCGYQNRVSHSSSDGMVKDVIVYDKMYNEISTPGFSTFNKDSGIFTAAVSGVYKISTTGVLSAGVTTKLVSSSGEENLLISSPSNESDVSNGFDLSAVETISFQRSTDRILYIEKGNEYSIKFGCSTGMPNCEMTSFKTCISYYGPKIPEWDRFWSYHRIFCLWLVGPFVNWLLLGNKYSKLVSLFVKNEQCFLLVKITLIIKTFLS